MSRVFDEARGGPGAHSALRRPRRALAEGRVEHLLLDPERDYSGVPIVALEPVDDDPELPVPDRLVAAALATSARVTPVEGAAAERLDATEGVAALLRY